MRLVKFANNAMSKLAANVSAVGTTITLLPGDGSKFPALTTGQYFMATLVKVDGTTEVVKVTARSSDTLTVVRAAEAVAGTVATAYAFSAGDRLEMRLTAGALGGELDRIEAAGVISALNKNSNYTVTAADVTSLIRADTASGQVTITLPAVSSLTDDFDIIIAKVTNDANSVVIQRSGSTDLINGATSYTIFNQYQSAWLIADRSTNTWTVISSGISAVNTVVDSGTGDGTTPTVTLTGDPGSKNNVLFVVGGVYQQKATFSISGTTLTPGATIPNGVKWEAVWSAPLTVGTPSDGTVTTIKMADGALAATVAGLAKMADGFLQATTAGLAKMADGFLAATTAGRAKMADGYVNAAKLLDGVLSADATGLAKMADGFLSATAAGLAKMADGFLAATAAGRAKMADGFVTAAKLDGAQSGAAPIFGARAWVNFNSVPLSGTYGRTGTTVTVSMTAHGMTTGQIANLTFAAGTGGTATSGHYSVTVIDANSFTITDTASGTISGSPSVTRNIHIRASGNVSSITDNGVGDYTVNFTTAMADVNYAVSVNNWTSSGYKYVYGIRQGFSSAFTTSSVRIFGGVVDSNFNTAADSDSLTVVIFR